MHYIWDKRQGKIHSEHSSKDLAESILSNLIMSNERTPEEVYVHEFPESWAHNEARMYLSDGTWTKPVWHNTPWYTELYLKSGVFVHVDEEDPNFVRCFPNDRALYDLRATKMKPGKFLKQYHGDILSSDDILKWTDVHKEQWISGNTLSWANTPEEIAQVYSMDATFRSCMQYSFDIVNNKWRESAFSNRVYIHPTAAYGAGDLSVAYLHKGDKLTARAVVWKEKGLVGRVYGDAPSLRKALKEEGVNTSSDSNNYASLAGAKLLKLPFYPREQDHVDSTRKYYITPYIDGSGCYAKDIGDYLELVEADDIGDLMEAGHTLVATQSACGYANSTHKCANCNRTSFHNYKVAVGRMPDGTVEYSHCCGNCLGTDYNYSDIGSYYFNNKAFPVVQVCVSAYGTMYQGAAGLDNIDQVNGTWYRKRDIIDMADGTKSTVFEVDRTIFQSSFDNKYYPISERVRVYTPYNSFSRLYMTREQAAFVRGASVRLGDNDLFDLALGVYR